MDYFSIECNKSFKSELPFLASLNMWGWGHAVMTSGVEGVRLQNVLSIHRLH